MVRFIMLATVLILNLPKAEGQCLVGKDVYGQIVTTCEVYELGSNADPSHKQVIYLGSQYLTFPTWQTGTIQLDQGGKDVVCELAYDLVASTVMCRFEGDMTANHVTPYAFTIDGIKFIRQLNNVLGVDYQLYLTVLHDGPTKLMKNLTSRLVLAPTVNTYDKSSYFNGSYQVQEKYYIRKGDARPEITDLSKSSLVKILYDQSEKIARKIPGKRLTIDGISEVLAYYDSLTVVKHLDKPPLSTDAVFNQYLHNKIKYPAQAWPVGIYGRVYVGFDVTEQGQLTNIVTLSPENGGFGFDQAVRQVLSKVTKLKSDYKGTYALPVAFTYTNAKDQKEAHVPVNTLQANRFGERTVLTEFVVPMVVSKPGITAKEAWGYYK